MNGNLKQTIIFMTIICLLQCKHYLEVSEVCKGSSPCFTREELLVNFDFGIRKI